MILKPTSCSGCPLKEFPYGCSTGYVPAWGTGDNGVLVILEAAGKDEAAEGVPLVGASGQALFGQLKRIGIEREGFRIHNVLSCQPPNNKLIKQPYTEAAIAHCSPNIEKTILDHVAHCKVIGKTPVIIAMGKFAAFRVMGWTNKNPIVHEDHYTYPFWLENYKCWAINAPHPSHVMQGNNHLWDLVRLIVQRALDIATNGLIIEEPPYLLDPEPLQFEGWVSEFLEELKKNPKSTYLSYDIETPYKQKKSEDELGKEEDSDDYTILRCSFCWKPGNAVSVKWESAFMRGIERLFTSGALGLNWNGENYDNVRIIRYIQNFNLISLDGMLAWHVLQSAQLKGLGAVTPFYWPNTLMWKHLSDEQPAFYNAKDADAALRNWLGILPSLHEFGLYPVFERHVLKVNEVLRYMTGKGIPLDLKARQEAEYKLSSILNGFKQQINDVVPLAAKELKIYKKTPADTRGMIEVDGSKTTKKCSICGAINVKADHFKTIGKKRLKLGEPENVCFGGVGEKTNLPSKLWALPLEFKLSTKRLSAYQIIFKHKAILNKEKKVTFDESAIKRLRQAYPNDPLYATIIDHREVATLLSRYVGRIQEGGTIKGGLQVSPDGRIRTTYTHNPSTLRLASQNPNLQNLPRPDAGNKAALANIIRNLIVPTPGWALGARDFSGIEAVLVGYDAKARNYIRLALRDVHSFYTAYALYEVEGKLLANDLPQLSWSDDKLFARLADIKREFKKERNSLYKHLVHAINFGQGAYGARDKIYEETNIIYDIKLISKLMALYKELFPEIPTWQKDIRNLAHENGYLQNEFGYVHRFNSVFRFENKYGYWERKPGDDAEAVLAFKPQSNAAGIMKEALLRCYFDRFEEAGQYMRLTTHDEILWECPPDIYDSVDAIFVEEMERPVLQLPLPASYNMGSYLHILTEGKSGISWGVM